MDSENDLLHRIRIASPCAAAWEEMRGDDRARFCQHCRLNVYSLSAMEPEAAEALVREKEGRLCVRYYARPDGTMLVKDCPVGFHAARRMLLAQLGTIATAFAVMFGSVPILSGSRRQAIRNSWLGQIEPFRSFFEWLDPIPPYPQLAFPRLGSIAMPVPPAALLKNTGARPSTGATQIDAHPARHHASRSHRRRRRHTGQA